MSKILVIAANGSIARILVDRILKDTDHELVLFLRHADRLHEYQNKARVALVEGDILDNDVLSAAMQDVDLVYSNAGGVDLGEQTKSILTAMQKTGKDRFVFISALGARHEVTGKFGEWNEQAIKDYLPGFRASAKLLDASNIIFTELRPAWLTNNDEIDYEITKQGNSFKGTEISRASVADFVLKVLNKPSDYQRASIGLNKPNTSNDKPAWL
ncbi:MAG: NAD(P)H-binding protein [Oenococcus oeni]